jgi:tRNA(Arg) A34 adenosine deaminase TadA
MLDVAIAEARAGDAEGGVPIGGALFDAAGELLGKGHNQRVQRGDPSAHGETEAFRNTGRRRSYRDVTIATTLAPCWYCSGLIRQFGIGTVVVGESSSSGTQRSGTRTSASRCDAHLPPPAAPCSSRWLRAWSPVSSRGR